jgi:hypothetical protein
VDVEMVWDVRCEVWFQVQRMADREGEAEAFGEQRGEKLEKGVMFVVVLM